jgi:hypothetical protein
VRKLVSSVFIAVHSVLCLGGCNDFRDAPAGPDAAASTPMGSSDAAVTSATPIDPRATGLALVGDLPPVDYRGVAVFSRSKVIVVGDETILDWNGSAWQHTHVGGVDLGGAWTNGVISYAVGTLKQTNTGVFMLRTAKTGRWIQLATVPHGLRSVWGDDDFRVAVGHDGVAYFGVEDVPFKNGVQHDPFDGVPRTLFSPLITAVGGNSRKHVIAVGGAGGWFGYDGAAWKGYAQKVDATRTFRSVWGPPGDSLDVIIGSNYYGLWRFRGTQDQNGERLPASLLNEERDDPIRGSQYINGIWGESTSRFLAVGTSGRVMKHEEGAPPSVIATAAGAHDLWGVAGTGWDDLWIVGDAGVVLHGSLD